MALSAVKKPKTAPWPTGDESAGSFGSWLRSQREARGVELAEIAEESKISLRYLEAFEDERFDILPAEVFAKGFLREYSRFVGLDADEVVNHYLSASRPEEEEEDEDEPAVDPVKAPGSWGTGLLMALSVVVVIILVAMLAFHSERRRSVETPAGDDGAQVASVSPGAGAIPADPAPADGEPVDPPPSTAPGSAAGPGPAATGPQAPLRVTLDFHENCWVEIVVDGRRRIQEEQVQGASLQLDAQRFVELTLGNSGGVDIQVNGYRYDLGRSRGEVTRGVRIDLDTVRELSGRS